MTLKLRKGIRANISHGSDDYIYSYKYADAVIFQIHGQEVTSIHSNNIWVPGVMRGSSLHYREHYIDEWQFIDVLIPGIDDLVLRQRKEKHRISLFYVLSWSLYAA